MKLLLILVAVLVLAIIIVLTIGAMLPRHHSVARSIVLAKPPAEVYAAITNFAAAPSWRKDVQSVQILSPARFRETGKHHAVTYDVLEQTPTRLVTRIVEQNLGYSGSWTYTLTPEGQGTRLEIREDGDVSNLLFRFVSRFVMGQTVTIDRYLEALKVHLG
jgi:hypothetical protein